MGGSLGRIKAASLDSPRLQRVLALLADGRPHTTRAIVRKARIVAVNAAISELRHHGAEIDCVKQAAPGGHGLRFYYTMTKAPEPT
jgi:biotin operon repressor